MSHPEQVELAQGNTQPMSTDETLITSTPNPSPTNQGFTRKTSTAFLGIFGVHNLYTRRYTHFLYYGGWLVIISRMGGGLPLFICGGILFILWIIDGFRIPSMVRYANASKEERQLIWSMYDIYLLWIPPFGWAGIHHMLSETWSEL